MLAAMFEQEGIHFVGIQEGRAVFSGVKHVCYRGIANARGVMGYKLGFANPLASLWIRFATEMLGSLPFMAPESDNDRFWNSLLATLNSIKRQTGALPEASARVSDDVRPDDIHVVVRMDVAICTWHNTSY